jgi:hypothetical protein
MVAPIITGSGTPVIFVIPNFQAQIQGNLFILAKKIGVFLLAQNHKCSPDVAEPAKPRMLELAHRNWR